LKIFFGRAVARVVKRQTAELSLAREKILGRFAHTAFAISSPLPSFPTHTPVARTVHPRNFAPKMPSRASIS